MSSRYSPFRRRACVGSLVVLLAAAAAGAAAQTEPSEIARLQATVRMVRLEMRRQRAELVRLQKEAPLLRAEIRGLSQQAQRLEHSAIAAERHARRLEFGLVALGLVALFALVCAVRAASRRTAGKMDERSPTRRESWKRFHEQLDQVEARLAAFDREGRRAGTE